MMNDDKITEKLVEIDSFMRNKLVTRSEFNETRSGFNEAIKGLVTRNEFNEAIKGLVTRNEFNEAIKGLVTRNEFNEAKNEIIGHVDGFIKLHETLDHELVALRAKTGRLDDRVTSVEERLGSA